MAIVTYYYPYNYGAVALAASPSNFSGVQTYTAQVQGTSGYTKVVVDTANLSQYQVTLNYGTSTPVTETLYQTNFSTSGVNEVTDGTYNFILSNSPVTTGQTFQLTNTGSNTSTLFQPNSSFLNDPTVCFVAGTRIATKRGEVAVEDLAVGDDVVTSSGQSRPIRWLGHRNVDCRHHTRPSEVQPVRIAAHAFADNRPSRDLRVSPGHSVCVDVLGEVLIPAGALMNGSTIVQEEVESVTYWHVELDEHDVVLAENLPCESYLEMGNRGFFAGSDAVELHAVPDAPVTTHADFCRPFRADGELVAFVRDRLAARSTALGWSLEQAPLYGNLHIEVDGERFDPDVRGLSARFLVPASPKEVWLVSDTAVPAFSGQGADRRVLGVCLGALTVDDGFGEPRTVAADDPSLCVGFHNVEAGPQRWTAGRARLPCEIWEDCRDAFFLRLDIALPTLPRWRKADPDAIEVSSLSRAN